MKRLIALVIALVLAAGCHHIDPRRSVIQLVTATGTSGGTGFEVVGPSGKIYTLTNAHVCKGLATNAVVGDRTVPLRVIEIADTTDLCLLEAITSPQPLYISKRAPQNEDKIDIYGYGLLQDIQHSSGSYVGEIHGPVLMLFMLMGLTNAPEYTTATILPGNSGSPVLNSDGEVIGVAFASGPLFAWRALIIGLPDRNQFLKAY